MNPKSNVKMTDLATPGFSSRPPRWWASRFAEPTHAQLEGWSAIRRGERYAHRGAHRLGQDARRLPDLDRPAPPRRPGEGELPDEVRVIYVSPLKALSADIHKNLAEPRREIRSWRSMGYRR